MTAISNAQNDMNNKYMAYISAAAHSRRARKIEKMRAQVLESITQSRFKTIDLPYYKGDNSLRQSAIDFLDLYYKIFSEDYARVINMEDIAEQSFDQMQAYLLIKEKISEKLRDAGKKMEDASKIFAKKYSVNVIDRKDAFEEKMETAGKLNRYLNEIYLTFFKCYWQDGELVKALNSKKMNDAEQARNSLIKFANEGLQVLDTLKPFNNDPSFAVACKKALISYKKMAEKEIPQLLEYYLKEENFEKIKKTFDTKSPSNRTQQDVDGFNKAVNEMNAGIDRFNKVNNMINDNRNILLQQYNDSERTFVDVHMPYHKK
jgi:hypothetical protein